MDCLVLSPVTSDVPTLRERGRLPPAHYRQFRRLPCSVSGAPAARTLFWAHELTLHDAGRGGGNGSADLMTVDETGMVWLIEVKFNFSLESGTQVWHGQLARYRNALMTMSWQEIVRYTHRFLTGFEQTKPQLPPKECRQP